MLSVPSPITRYFDSGQQALPIANPALVTLTLAHGMGIVPKHVEVIYVCQVAELGYAIGDVALPAPVQNKVLGLWWDATNVYVMSSINGGTPSQYYVFDRTNGGNSQITNANWKVIVRAWA